TITLLLCKRAVVFRQELWETEGEAEEQGTFQARRFAMLYVSLLLSAFLFAGTQVGIRSKRPVASVVLWCVVFIGVSCFNCVVMLPAVGLQGLLLVAALMVWAVMGKRCAAFLAASGAATIAAYGIVCWFAWQDVRTLDELRTKYRYES